MDEPKDIIYEDMKNLRTKSNKDERVVKFKKSVFGGIKSKEVNDYISSITAQHKRTGQAYQERIDEYNTFTEMLTRERDDAIFQLQSKTQELTLAKEEIETLKLELDNFKNIDESIKESQTANELRESIRAQKEGELLDVFKDNYFLKSQLEQILNSRDEIAGENAVLKKQFELLQEKIDTADNQNAFLKNKITEINSAIRQNEISKSHKISEFSEKQIYAIKETAKTLNDALTSLETMKNDVSGIHDEIRQNSLLNIIKEISEKD